MTSDEYSIPPAPVFVNAQSVENERFSDVSERRTPMNAIARIREYMQGHGVRYTLRRLGQIGCQRVLGTYDRRRTREKTPPE
jgi:hypothetical protein